ncbi:MAG: DUF2332 family protein [Boseongicola sp.]
MSVIGAFGRQAKACADLGSPFMAQLMALFAERLRSGGVVSDHILNWSGDPEPSADCVPLRLAGALHALRLQGKALEAVYPPAQVDDDALWHSVVHAMDDHASQITEWLGSPPQTNEVRRAAVILPALAMLREIYDRPVALFELGTSGGLNLRADLFRLELVNAALGPAGSPVLLTPEWTGAMPPTDLPQIVSRRGVDLNPIDPVTPEGRLRLLAYLWPDQPDRMKRTEGAIALASDHAAELSRDDAGAWLVKELARHQPGTLQLVFHTIAWQYFPESTRSVANAALAAAAGEATVDAPLARLSMENADGRAAAVTLTTWPGGKERLIARADFHGRWVDWS